MTVCWEAKDCIAFSKADGPAIAVITLSMTLCWEAKDCIAFSKADGLSIAVITLSKTVSGEENDCKVPFTENVSNLIPAHSVFSLEVSSSINSSHI